MIINSYVHNSATPTIIVNLNSIDFGPWDSGEADQILPFTVEGNNLTGPITITKTSDPSNKYRCNSTGDNSDTLPIVLNETGGTVSLTTLYAVFRILTAQANNSGIFGGTFELTSPGAVTKTVTLSAQLTNQVVVYFEDFDTASVSVSNPPDQYKFPTGWTDPSSPYEPLIDVFVYDDGGISVPYSSGSGLRSLIFLDASVGLVSVTSAPFSTIGKSDLTLDFLMVRSSAATPPNIVLEWSDDNSTWNTLSYTQISNDDTWYNVNTINLPSGAENKANIYLKFSQTADGGGNFTAIDDVLVRGIE